MRFHLWGAATCLAILAGQAGHAADLTQGLAARIATLEQDPAQNAFELGAMRVLRGVETGLQTMNAVQVETLVPLPLLRLAPGGAGKPPPQPGFVNALFSRFATDLDTARADLTRPGAEEQSFTLRLGDLWFDVDGNGAQDPGEDGVQILGPLFVPGGRMITVDGRTDLADVVVRFDAADQAWLLAYTHALSATAELVQAFDATRIAEDLAQSRALLDNLPSLPYPYPPEEVRANVKALIAQQAVLRDKVNALYAEMGPLQDEAAKVQAQRDAASDDATRQALQVQLDALYTQIDEMGARASDAQMQQMALDSEIEGWLAKLPSAPDGDSGGLQAELAGWEPTAAMIYVVLTALQQQPDKQHLTAARDHWRAMVAANRDFWQRLEAETDDDREWVPASQQTSALGITLPEGTGAAWLRVLEDASAVLDGQLLVMHPLMPPDSGIDVSAYFDDPVAIDLLGAMHGVAFYRYAKQGPRMSASNWDRFTQLVGGRGFAFALLLN